MSTTANMAAASMGFGAVIVGLCLHEPVERPLEPRAEAVLQEGVREADGTAWWAHTTVMLASGPVTIDEQAVLDDAGMLVHASTKVVESGETVQTWYEPRTALVTTETPTTTWHQHVPPGDAPWVYGPVRSSRGTEIGTPLAGWAAYWATKRHEYVRRVESTRSALVPIDQVVVATEGDGCAVIVGDDVVDVEGGSLVAVHLHATETALVRTGVADPRLVRFRSVSEPSANDGSFINGT